MTGKLSRKVLWLIAMLVFTTSAFAQRVAVLNFNAGSGVTQMEVDGLSSIFNTYFSPKGAEIVERTSVDKILQEQKFQNSRFTNTDMVALGEMLNVSLIVVGDINVVMEQYNVDVRVVNVQTGTTVAKDGTSFSTGGSYRDMMKELGERLSKSLELEIEKFQITSDRNSNGNNNDNNGKASVLPKNMTTKITEDNSKRERTDVVVLEGFLKLYPEDLGEFSSEPSWLIKLINQQERYGYNSWRLPTQEELDFIRSNGYLSGNKYMTKENPSGSPLGIRGGFWWASLLLVVLFAVPQIGGKSCVADGLYQVFAIVVMFPVIVLIGAGSKTTDKRSAKWCETLGNLSYPLYITHFPLMYMQMAWVSSHKDSPVWHHVVLNLGILLVAIGIAWAFLKLYDEPVRAWLKKKLYALPAQKQA